MADKNSIESRHRSVVLRSEQWQRIEDVMAGPDRVKSQDRRKYYLPRLPGQRVVVVPDFGRVDEYDNYVQRAVLASAQANRVLTGMCGMVFRKEPIFEFPQPLEQDLDNITLDGTSAAGFAKHVLRQNLSVGFGCIVVDWDEILGRPYVRLYDAQSVTNWRLSYFGGRPVLTQLVLREIVDEPAEWGSESVEQYRVFALDNPEGTNNPDAPFGPCSVQRYRKISTAQGESWTPYEAPLVPTKAGRPLPFIPAVAFNPAGVTWEPGKPPMLELIDIILAHYKNSADYENVLHYAGAGHTFLVTGVPAAEQANIRVGGSSAIVTSETGADAKWVTTGGAGGAELLTAMEAKERAMGIAMARLLLSQDKRVAETAEAQRVAFAGDDATLSDVVDSTEEALERALMIYVWWATTAATVNDVEDEVDVSLNRDFIEMAMDANQLSVFGIEVEAGRMSKRRQYFLAQRGELTEPGVSFEDEQAQIALEKQGEDPQPLDNGGNDIVPPGQDMPMQDAPMNKNADAQSGMGATEAA